MLTILPHLTWNSTESINLRNLIKSLTKKGPRNVDHHEKRVQLSLNGTCSDQLECSSGFFCKNNDCVAKRSEGSLCPSGRNDECECGKCVLDSIQWIRICYNPNTPFCSNSGRLFFSLLNLNQSRIFSCRKRSDRVQFLSRRLWLSGQLLLRSERQWNMSIESGKRSLMLRWQHVFMRQVWESRTESLVYPKP